MRWFILFLGVLCLPSDGLADTDCDQATQLVIEAFDAGHTPDQFPMQKKVLKQALSLCPDHAEAHNNLASVYEQEADYDKAVFHYKQALRSKPDFTIAWYGLGQAYSKSGRFPLALEAYLRACHEDKTDAWKKIEALLKNNRFMVTESGRIMDKESLIMLFDKERRAEITKMISDCGFRASVVPEITFRNILFDTGSADIKPVSVPQLNEIGEALKALGDLKIKISGHTDRQPFKGHTQEQSDRMNMALSQKRAQAVARYLINMNIPAQRIRTAGYGPSRPVVDENTVEAYAKNRRVVVAVVE